SPTTTSRYTLSLHDALPIFPAAWCTIWQRSRWLVPAVLLPLIFAALLASLSLKRYANSGLFSVLAQQLRVQNLFAPAKTFREFRSEEHTSELQSRENLVCRL